MKEYQNIYLEVRDSNNYLCVSADMGCEFSTFGRFTEEQAVERFINQLSDERTCEDDAEREVYRATVARLKAHQYTFTDSEVVKHTATIYVTI